VPSSPHPTDPSPPRPRPPLSRAERLSLALTLLLYAALAAHLITLPGLHSDEALQAGNAVEIVEGSFLPLHDTVTAFSFQVWGRTFPMMTIFYIGTIKTYLFVPFMLLLGPTLTAIRVTTIALGCVALICTFGFARAAAGRAAAWIALVLLAADPAFITYTREDHGPVAVMMAVKMAALWAIALWWRDRRSSRLVWAALLLGIGLSDKANFIWMVAAAPLALFLAEPRTLLRHLPPPRRLALIGAAALAAFSLGAYQFLLFNLTREAESLQPFFDALGSGGGGAAWLPLDRAIARAAVHVELLSGITHPKWILDELVPWRGTVLPWLTLPALLYGALLAPWTGPAPRRRFHRFILVLYLLLFLQIVLTPQAYEGHHSMILYPLPHLLIAAACAALLAGGRGPLRELRLAAVATALALQLWSSGRLMQRFWHDLERTGGRLLWSDATSRLAEWAATAEECSIVCIAGGIQNALGVNTRGRVPIRSVLARDDMSAIEERAFHDNIEHALAHPDEVFVAFAEENRFDHFAFGRVEELLELEGYRLEEIAAFPHRDGRPALSVLEARPIETPLNRAARAAAR